MSTSTVSAAPRRAVTERRRQPARHVEGHDRGRTSSTVSPPLRRRRASSVGAASADADGDPHLRCRCGYLDAVPDRRHRLLQRRRCVAAATVAPVTSIPSGSASDSVPASQSRSIGSASSTSRYSASLSCPTDSARPKLTFGRGEKPWVKASGSAAPGTPARTRGRRRGAEMKRTLPCFVNRSRTGVRCPAQRRSPTAPVRVEQADRHHRASRSWPVPWLPPAGGDRPKRPRARAPGPCTPHSRSRASTGNRGARARRARPASPARGSRGGDRPRRGPRAAPRRRRGGGSRTSRGRGPRPPSRRASGRGRSARSTPGTSRRRATPARSPRRSGGRPGSRSPRRTVARGSCQRTCARRSGAGRRGAARPCAESSVDAVLTEPLERRVRLRHEATHRRGAARAAWWCADRSRRPCGRDRRCRACPRRSRWAGPMRK